MKYLLHLAFKGTDYHGWQRQPEHISVQEVLEDTLSKMLKKKTNCIGCGRTDAGVHASQFFCHIVVEKAFDFDPVFRLNKMLPEDISIFEIMPVGEKFHAQHGAAARTYTYLIHTVKNALLSGLSTYCSPKGLDFEKMKTAAAVLPNYLDFKAMCKHPDFYNSTICRVSAARISVSENGKKLRFDITANRFLRGMVRLLVGNILEVGYGRMELEKFEHHLQSGETPKFYKAAPPQGLYLSGVKYPDLDIPAQTFGLI